MFWCAWNWPTENPGRKGVPKVVPPIFSERRTSMLKVGAPKYLP
jgi:hypothetical protein